MATWLGPPILGASLAVAITAVFLGRGVPLVSARRSGVALATGIAWAAGVLLASVGAYVASTELSIPGELSPAVPMYILAAQLWAGISAAACASVATALFGGAKERGA